MAKKRYKIWIDRRIVHAIEVSGDEMTPAQARDMVYEAQEHAANCTKHSKSEKADCNFFLEIIDTELYENRKWKVLA